MATYEKLFESWDFCGFMLRSRICVPPLVIYTWGDDTGCVTDRHISHYRALANGGAGLVIQEATAVCREGRLTLDQLGIWEDGQVSGLRRIADTLHAAGMPAIVQLSHAGLMGAVPEYRVSPSGFQYEADGELRTGRALDAEELRTIEQCFIDGARRASEAGFDGVELHASHGYLLSEFMNTAVNRRSDAYGADGLLILKNIIEGIRGVTPPGFLLGVRMGAFEPDLAAGIRNAKQLEAWGVDFLDVFYGCDWVAQLETPAGYSFNASIYGAKCIKQAVQLPVFAVNQIRTGEQAEAILQDTGVDMAVVGRGSLVNYAWGNDVKAGRDPGHCLDCTVCRWKFAPANCPGRLLYQKKNQ